MARALVRLCIGIALVLSLVGAGWSQNLIPHHLPFYSASRVGPDRPTILQDADSASAPSTAATAVTTPSYLVLIVLDGAETSYLKLGNTPNLHALMKNGTQYNKAIAGILESETPSGHATIDSGSEPKRDGILSFGWANADNTTVSLFDEARVRAGMMEQIMRASGTPTIATLVHRANPAARVVALSGYKYYAADALGGPDADVIMYYNTRANGSFGPTAIPGHTPPASVINDPSLVVPSKKVQFTQGNHLAMSLAVKTFDTMHQAVTLINLPDSDWPLGHPWGAGSDVKDAATLMTNFDKDLGMLENAYRKAGVLDKTLFVITSDHGFSPTQHQVLKPVIANSVTRVGTKIIRDTYHTGAYLWLQDSTKAAAAANTLAAKKNPYIQSVYYRAPGSAGAVYTRAKGSPPLLAPGMESANQYLLSTFNGPNGPDLAVFMTEGAASIAGGQNTWKADHGGADWQSQHVPLIISGPGVRHSHYSNWPARLEDVAPTALTALGVPASPMQGIVLADALRSPSAAQTSTQAAMAATLRPVIASMQAEAKAELARK